MKQARAPNERNRPLGKPAVTVNEAIRLLAIAITALIRLSTADVVLTGKQLDKLRERRHQLSVVLDGLVRFNHPSRKRSTGRRRTRN